MYWVLLGIYTLIVAILFVAAIVDMRSYIWAVKITCKINNKILEDDLDAELKDALNKFGAVELNYGTKRKTTLSYRPFDYSANQIIKHHFKWALSSPRGSNDPPKQYFYTRLLLMNSVIHFLANVLKLRWFGGVKLILPIIFYGCASVVWPVAGIASIFHLRNEANKQRRNPDSQPWFATERSMPAMPKD